LKSGWVDDRAVPVVAGAAPGLVATDAANGFAQTALCASAPPLRDKARRQGIAAVAIRRVVARHRAVCRQGLHRACDGQRAAAHGGLGGQANEPRHQPDGVRLPASGAQAARLGPGVERDRPGEVLLAAERGLPLPEGVGLDADGQATAARAVLDGGTLLPFGGHKGSSIAFMIEIVAGALTLTGGCFGFEGRSGEYPGAQTPKAGQAIILIDPMRVPRNHHFERIERLFAAVTESGVERLPAERRYAQRERSLRQGIVVSDRNWAMLQPK
jgi:delta1-piperideine-2-carboxylate reductase